MILKCAIIDDEPLAAELLASYVKKTPNLSLVGAFSSAIIAMKEIRDNPVDVLFLDIQMPELSGLEFAKILPQSTKVIFTTAFNLYAIESYKVKAIDYLLKPISYEDFIVSVGKAFEYFNYHNNHKQFGDDQFVFVKSEYKLVKIQFSDIIYVEGGKDYVKFFFEDGRPCIMSLMNMKRIDDYLPHPKFLRVHRSYIVHMSKVKLVDRARIVFGNVFIPISESYKEEVQRYFDNFTIM